ncbi:putative transposase [Halococcus salifodinae DSM 8989]|uniref:Putative transposase n=2 Tax=Halococcus salifodinae TaxID=36738 RepID=M0NDJ7_9EURY|nr:putative transposase [Halococcus salifodinae DSM 8989]
MQIRDPAGNSVAGWKHAVLHFLRVHMEATLSEVLDWAEEMERMRARLALQRGEFIGPSALCKSFDHAPMAVWRELLRRESELLDQSGHAAIDATYFDRREASSHYLKRCDRDVRTIQATFLVDTAQGAVIDVHCSAKWPNGTNVGPQVALRNAGDLLSLAADKGYDDMSFREALWAEGVRSLIKHRVFAPYDHAHNARIESERYHQRSICECVNSVIKRSYGSAVRARAWYRQFREISLTAAVYNVEQALKS